MIKDEGLVRYAYGTVDDVKLNDGNWSVKVICHPQPPIFHDYPEPLRYGGWVEPTDENPDGYGEWIPLGHTPEEVAILFGDELLGRFVEIAYVGAEPWRGRAYIINQPGTEQSQVLTAPERGPARSLSAVWFWV